MGGLLYYPPRQASGHHFYGGAMLQLIGLVMLLPLGFILALDTEE